MTDEQTIVKQFIGHFNEGYRLGMVEGYKNGFIDGICKGKPDDSVSNYREAFEAGYEKGIEFARIQEEADND